MIEKFKSLFFVKISLISLYLALTIPIPFFSSQELKIISIIVFLFGLFLIISITNDYVETNDQKISYRTNFISEIFGKKSWEVFWKDIKLIKSSPTSQGSKVYYFVTYEDKNYLMPQRVENYEEFLIIISKKTGIDVKGFNYISPLWTYKLLTGLSVLMIAGEIAAFIFKYYQY